MKTNLNYSKAEHWPYANWDAYGAWIPFKANTATKERWDAYIEKYDTHVTADLVGWREMFVIKINRLILKWFGIRRNQVRHECKLRGDYPDLQRPKRMHVYRRLKNAMFRGKHGGDLVFE